MYNIKPVVQVQTEANRDDIFEFDAKTIIIIIIASFYIFDK